MGFDLTTSFANHILNGINHILPRLPIALYDLLLGILIIRLLKRGIRLILKATRMQPGLRYVLTSIIETIMWILLTIALLNELGFSGVIFFFTGSIAAIGIAMAAGGSTLVSDIIAGVFLAQDHDFNVGDEIAVMNDRPIIGVIERMDARRTRLRDERGLMHVIPNSIIERKEWVVVHKRHEVSALAKATKTAKRISIAALDKRSAIARSRRQSRNNAQ
jgi:small-conductance mechanosensitive channel